MSKKGDFEDDIEDDIGADEDGLSDVNAQQLQSLVEARGIEVRSLVSRGDYVNAVLKALEDPVTGKAPENLKEQNLQTVLAALTAPKSADIASILKAMSPGQIDILLKFVYRGMERAELGYSGQMLAWHEKTVEQTGLGGIVRVITDRRTV